VDNDGVDDVTPLVGEGVGANSKETVEMSMLERVRVDVGGNEEGVSVERIGGLDGCGGRERGMVNLKSVEVAAGFAEKLSMVMVGGGECKLGVSISEKRRLRFGGILVMTRKVLGGL
jgi:hypothetical protein